VNIITLVFTTGCEVHCTITGFKCSPAQNNNVLLFLADEENGGLNADFGSLLVKKQGYVVPPHRCSKRKRNIYLEMALFFKELKNFISSISKYDIKVRIVCEFQ